MISRSFGLIGAGLLMSLTAGPAIAADDRTCVAEAVEGDTANYWNDGTWAELREGQPLDPESKVSTGGNTRVKITCDDGVVVTVGVETELNLEQLAGTAGRDRNVVLQLISGIVGLVAPERTWSRFEVRTPVAIASVRSTEWLVEHAVAEGAAVFVRTGRVVVSLRDGRAFTLGDGEGITISPGGVPGEVKTWGAPRIEQSTEALGFDWQ